MEITKKDLEYYRKNAEEDFLTTPISVLRYITEMEQALLIHDVSKNEVAGCDHCRDEQGFTVGNMYVCDKCGRQVP